MKHILVVLFGFCLVVSSPVFCDGIPGQTSVVIYAMPDAQRGGVLYRINEVLQVECRLSQTASAATSRTYWDVIGWYDVFGLELRNGFSGATNLSTPGYALLYRLERPLFNRIHVGIVANILSIYPELFTQNQVLNEWSAFLSIQV